MKKIRRKKGKLSSSTLHNIYKAINALFSTAKDWELIDKNSCNKIDLPPFKHKKSEVFDAEKRRFYFSYYLNMI
ncbi:hypothetical protein J6TS1_01240 [Siminovitchia terrae]|uniref:Uncharacterized protein n=1 Tax=Siminovitchia terrae TaxID=1914933 RepID=A0ABQ4KRI3_SIMTE|nr:hypothetical protein J6TS1_01240 [Siminovitchia terrae]